MLTVNNQYKWDTSILKLMCHDPFVKLYSLIFSYMMLKHNNLLLISVFIEAADVTVVSLLAGLCGGGRGDHVRDGIQGAREMDCCHTATDD